MEVIKIIERFSMYTNKIINKSKNISISTIYIFIVVLFVLIVAFLFNSKSIFEKNDNFKSTNLFESQTLGVREISLSSRKYNPKTGFLELMFFIDDKESVYDPNLEQQDLQFAIKERSNPLKQINMHVRKIDSNNYVVLANLAKKFKWSVVSVAVLESNNFNKKDLYENSNVRFYSNKIDTMTDKTLKEKNTNEYLADIVSVQITKQKREEKDIDKKINDEKEANDYLRDNINKIQSNKKYQVKSELQNSNQMIEELQRDIDEHSEKIQKLKSNKIEILEKIEKLNEKRNHFLTMNN